MNLSSSLSWLLPLFLAIGAIYGITVTAQQAAHTLVVAQSNAATGNDVLARGLR